MWSHGNRDHRFPTTSAIIRDSDNTESAVEMYEFITDNAKENEQHVEERSGSSFMRLCVFPPSCKYQN